MMQANRSQKTSDLLEKIRVFFTAFPPLMPKSKSLLSLFALSRFFKERREWFALVTLFKRGNCSRRSLQKGNSEQFALFQEQITL